MRDALCSAFTQRHLRLFDTKFNLLNFYVRMGIYYLVDWMVYRSYCSRDCGNQFFNCFCSALCVENG